MHDYTTGRAARALGVSQGVLRALCQAGLVAARSSPGGHWRITRDEVLRLRRQGVPDLPSQGLEDAESAPGRPPNSPESFLHPGLLADPSPEAIAAADEVIRLESEVKAIGLKRARAEGLDWFRKRKIQSTSESAERERAQLQSQSERVREKWEAAWIEYAFVEYVPNDCPAEIEESILRSLQETLSALEIRDPRMVIERLLRGKIDQSLSAWRRRQQTEKLIAEEIRTGLPTLARSRLRETQWESRARRVAREAIERLAPESSLTEIREAVRKTVTTVRAEYESQEALARHRSNVEQISGLVLEGAEARKAVRAALEKLPVSSKYSDLISAREMALVPYRAAERAHREAGSYLRFVHEYIEEIGNESEGEWNLGSAIERFQLAEKIKPTIQVELAKRLLTDNFSTDESRDDEIREFVEVCVDRELEL